MTEEAGFDDGGAYHAVIGVTVVLSLLVAALTAALSHAVRTVTESWRFLMIEERVQRGRQIGLGLRLVLPFVAGMAAVLVTGPLVVIGVYDACFGIVEIDPGHHSPLHRHKCEEMYYVLEGTGVLEQEGQLYPITKGDSVLSRVDVLHRVHNTGTETIRLVVVGGIMLVPLLAEWPTPSPYELFE